MIRKISNFFGALENQMFYHFLLILPRIADLLQLRSKKDNFWERRTHLSKTLNFVEKKPFFGFGRKYCVNDYLKIGDNCGYSGLRNCQVWFRSRGDAHTFVFFMALTVLWYARA